MDVPLIPPNCFASISPSIVSSSHFIIIDSNTLAAIGVSEIGLMFFTIVVLVDNSFVFGNGITFAICHSIGSIHSFSELLKLAVNGVARTLILHGFLTPMQECCQAQKPCCL